MPQITTNAKTNVQKVKLTVGEVTALKTSLALCTWLKEHDKNEAAGNAAVQLTAVIATYEKPAAKPEGDAAKK